MSGDLRLTGNLHRKAKKMLRRVCTLLDENGIPYILEGGTLLGIVRENRLLPWDNDLDITIAEEHLEQINKLESKRRLAGYGIKLRKSKYDMPNFPAESVRLVKVFTKRTLLKPHRTGLLDIFVKKKVGQQYFWLVGQHDHVLKSVPCHFYEKLGRIQFDGYGYSVPADYEEYLSYRYGDWKKPVKDYDYKKDDLSIVQ